MRIKRCSIYDRPCCDKLLTERGFMKKTLGSCLLTCAIFFTSGAFAEAGWVHQNENGKFYVEPGTVHVGPKGIFLDLDGDFIPVSSVHMDAHGVYVVGYEAVRMIRCSRCNKRYDADNQ